MTVIKRLDVELEVANIKVPEIPKGGSLVHGRIKDKANRGICGVTIFAEDEKGNTGQFLTRGG